MKKMLIALFAVLTITAEVFAACNFGCCPESGCCGRDVQNACRYVGGTGQVLAAKRIQCPGDCNCGC